MTLNLLRNIRGRLCSTLLAIIGPKEEKIKEFLA
jgi:hypothetical protein